MNGEIAQVIALVAHGNAYLHAERPEAPHLEATNSTFTYVRGVTFLRSNGVEIAAGVAGWLDWLREQEIDRLRFATAETTGPLPAHIASAFAGASNLGIVAVATHCRGLWTPRWTHTHGRSARPWRVTYREGRVGSAWSYATPDLAAARDELASRLGDAVTLAGDLSADFWRDWFSAAVSQLTEADPHTRHSDDVLPPFGYSCSARQVFAAAVGAWAFGGMGSWNDIIVQDEALRRRYDEVSAALYSSILTALAAVLHSGSRANRLS